MQMKWNASSDRQSPFLSCADGFFFSQRTSIKRITMLVWHAPPSNSFSCCLWLPTISIPFAPAVFCHFIVVSSCIWPFWVGIHTQKASTSKEFAECVFEGLVWHPPWNFLSTNFHLFSIFRLFLLYPKIYSLKMIEYDLIHLFTQILSVCLKCCWLENKTHELNMAPENCHTDRYTFKSERSFK